MDEHGKHEWFKKRNPAWTALSDIRAEHMKYKGDSEDRQQPNNCELGEHLKSAEVRDAAKMPSSNSRRIDVKYHQHRNEKPDKVWKCLAHDVKREDGQRCAASSRSARVGCGVMFQRYNTAL